MGEPRFGFAFLEHTADVGIRAWGPSISDAFEQAGVGLATLMGATAEPSGRTEPVHVEGVDLEGLLVAFLNELIYLFEIADGEGLASLKVTRLEPTSLDADVQLAPMDTSGEGLLVKAATYHQLEVVRATGRHGGGPRVPRSSANSLHYLLNALERRCVFMIRPLLVRFEPEFRVSEFLR